MQKYGEDLCVARTGTQVEILTGSGKAVEMRRERLGEAMAMRLGRLAGTRQWKTWLCSRA